MTHRPRIPTMDVLRGCAVLGILWMNITAFAYPHAVYFNPRAAGDLTIADRVYWAVGHVLVDGKMRALFSMLFGASMLLFIDHEEMAGRNGRRGQQVRLGWLFALGVAHLLLLWWGDILAMYAIVGSVALFFVRLEPIALVKRAFLFFLIHLAIGILMMTALNAWGNAAAAPDANADMRDGYAAFIGAFSDPGSAAVQKDYAVHRGSYAGIVADAWSNFPGQWIVGLILSFFDTLGFMLLGMAMLKSGFLTGRWDAAQYARTARHCFLVGIPPMIAIVAWILAGDFPPLRTFGSYILFSFPFRIPLAVGWAALILWLISRRPAGPVAGRLGAAGKLALSNYLGTSLVMTALFDGWGLGLYGHIPLVALPSVVLLGWALMLLWSKPWSTRFAMGPAEWLWRSLSRAELQQIRRSD